MSMEVNKRCIEFFELQIQGHDAMMKVYDGDPMMIAIQEDRLKVYEHSLMLCKSYEANNK